MSNFSFPELLTANGMVSECIAELFVCAKTRSDYEAVWYLSGNAACFTATDLADQAEASEVAALCNQAQVGLGSFIMVAISTSSERRFFI